MLTAEDLIAFEAHVADAFNAGMIRAPIHLSGGNEEHLISYFEENYRPGDWICSYWRSHYHCLLAGVSPTLLTAKILDGRSITLTFPERRIVTSAIVGGIIPIALGIALSIKRRGGEENVHCFVGDMTARPGAFYEAVSYAHGHDLPIHFVVEDNGKSVMTDTADIWGWQTWLHSEMFEDYVTQYYYILPWPHAGAGKRVEF